ncbi:hypothetical protein KIN20_008698 [Parelaphostrongylus tenuis]|uniref:Uncharacterized protein n=1 Tax=Parelaphostrongylus tenuis TaxID=148309 RepID=A0AAD5QJZ6_PARTN|nr:hypothetical protein KIN20_008698 [Parelaphostrongylus tenuis]
MHEWLGQNTTEAVLKINSIWDDDAIAETTTRNESEFKTELRKVGYVPFAGVMVILFNLTPALRFKVRVIFICLCWYAVSSASSITNKVVLQSYPYPITLALSNLIKYLTPISAGKAIAAVSAYFSLWKEFLSGENSNYNVISAIGPQGAGKSTMLSMIGGNNSQDMYRQYIFRPASREALESSRHQTTKIHAYITKFKEIFLDCQASNCASVLDEAIRYSRSTLTDGRYAINNYMEIVKLIAFLMQISHTILISVVLHTRAKSADFSSDVLQQRAALLRTFFSDSRRIRVSSEDDLVVFPLADIKP